MLVATPLAAVATSGARYDADFTIMARLRDASRAIVRTAGEPYRVGGSLDGERAVPGRVLFYRHPQLPAGRYRLAVAVAAGTRAGVARFDFEYRPRPPRVSA